MTFGQKTLINNRFKQPWMIVQWALRASSIRRTGIKISARLYWTCLTSLAKVNMQLLTYKTLIVNPKVRQISVL